MFIPTFYKVKPVVYGVFFHNIQARSESVYYNHFKRFLVETVELIVKGEGEGREGGNIILLVKTSDNLDLRHVEHMFVAHNLQYCRQHVMKLFILSSGSCLLFCHH